MPKFRVLILGVLVAAVLSLLAGSQAASAVSLDRDFGSNGTVVFDHGGTLAGGFVLDEFAGQARSVALESDGSVLVGGGSGAQGIVIRLRPDGGLDPGFGDGGVVRLEDFTNSSKPGYVGDPYLYAPRIVAILPRPDGSMLLVMRTFDFDGGEFGYSEDVLISLKADGSPDLRLLGGYERFLGQTLNSMPRTAVWTTGGKILIAGADFLSTFDRPGHEQAGYVMRRNPDGTYDSTYGGPAIGQDGWNPGFVKIRSAGWPNRSAISSLIPLSGGKVVAGGYRRFHPFLTKLDSTGRMIKTFGSPKTPGSSTLVYGGTQCGCFSSGVVAQTPRKGFIQVGHATQPGNELQNLLILKYGPGGRFVKSFGKNGVVRRTLKPYIRINAVAVQANGRILVAGSRGYENESRFMLLRFLPNGKPDKSFFGNGVYQAKMGQISTADKIVLDGRGHAIVVGGSSTTGEPGGSSSRSST